MIEYLSNRCDVSHSKLKNIGWVAFKRGGQKMTSVTHSFLSMIELKSCLDKTAYWVAGVGNKNGEIWKRGHKVPQV
jgi:hypothetical protein